MNSSVFYHEVWKQGWDVKLGQVVSDPRLCTDLKPQVPNCLATRPFAAVRLGRNSLPEYCDLASDFTCGCRLEGESLRAPLENQPAAMSRDGLVDHVLGPRPRSFPECTGFTDHPVCCLEIAPP